MTTTTLGALPIRSTLFRNRPWISDTVFIAHESLPLINLIAQRCPHRGRYQIIDGQFMQLADCEVPDLAALVDAADTNAIPCTMGNPPRVGGTDVETVELPEDRRVELIDVNGRRHHANGLWTHDPAVQSAIVEWRWSELPRPCVVGYDRKHRARIVVAAFLGEPSQ